MALYIEQQWSASGRSVTIHQRRQLLEDHRATYNVLLSLQACPPSLAPLAVTQSRDLTFHIIHDNITMQSIIVNHEDQERRSSLQLSATRSRSETGYETWVLCRELGLVENRASSFYKPASAVGSYKQSTGHSSWPFVREMRRCTAV
jgi:hypothetical protein